MNSRNCIIVLTKAPLPDIAKLRLAPHLSKIERAYLQRLFLLKIKEELDFNADIFICYTKHEGSIQSLKYIFGNDCNYFEKEGNSLGEYLFNAFKKVFDLGYKKAVLFSTDAPELSKKTINDAFDILLDRDFVFTPSTDGGYILVGMKELSKEVFSLEKYNHSNVLLDTVKIIEGLGKTYGLTEVLEDIDFYEDLQAYVNRMESRGIVNDIVTYIKTIKRISTIIPTYNSENTIENIIKVLDKIKDSTEIIFVDGGSTDKTLSLIPSEFKVLTSEKGRAVQLNTGARASTGNVLFFLCADCVPPDSFVDEIKILARSHKIGSFGVKHNSKNILILLHCFVCNLKTCLYSQVLRQQGLFIDKDLFFQMGMYKEIPIMEDLEFSQRIRERKLSVELTMQRNLFKGTNYDDERLIKKIKKNNKLRRMYRQGVDINKIYELDLEEDDNGQQDN